MNSNLAYKRPDYSSDIAPATAAKRKMVIEYPKLRIEVNKDNKDLLSSVPKSGTATISFDLAGLNIGDEGYSPSEDSEGCITLRVTNIDFGTKTDPAFKNGADALDAFMADEKKKAGNLGTEEEAGDEGDDE